MDKLESVKKFEQVSFFHDSELDLTAIIAVHDTTLGPGLGGCRIRHYESLDAALDDVLRLSEGMTYKSALAGLDLGGGKSVILASEKALANRRKLFLTFGKWVESLAGSYITAEDMGTSVEDIKIISEVTKHVSGSDPLKGGAGDPSPFTAKGVYLGIGACLERAFSSPDYQGKKVLIQGIGHVGFELAKLLAKSGADLVVCDTNEAQIKLAHKELSFEVCKPEEVYKIRCDVFAPCAMGGILNTKTIPLLNTKIVAGAANNQLASREDELELRSRGIIYAPDFAINSGGVIMCAGEIQPGGYLRSWVDALVDKIGGTIGKILDRSKESGCLAGDVAISFAQERISKVKGLA